MSNERRVPQQTILMAAAKIGCDPRTARKIVEGGADAARNLVHRERARDVLVELGITPGPQAAA